MKRVGAWKLIERKDRVEATKRKQRRENWRETNWSVKRIEGKRGKGENQGNQIVACNCVKKYMKKRKVYWQKIKTRITLKKKLKKPKKDMIKQWDEKILNS